MLIFDAGGGVTMRLLRREDAEELYRLIQANLDVLKPWMSWVEGTKGPEDTAAFIHGTISGFARGDNSELGVFVEGALAGVAGIHTQDRENRSAQLGYWLSQAFWGRGVMTRVAAWLCDAGFNSFRLERLEIHTAESNRRSRAVAERLGFSLEGRLRRNLLRSGVWHDRIIYGLLADEWKSAGGAAGVLATSRE